MNTRVLQAQIEPHLDKIERLLPPAYKLTLVCRYTGPEFEDANVLLTLDPDLTAVIGVIEKLVQRGPTFTGTMEAVDR